MVVPNQSTKSKGSDIINITFLIGEGTRKIIDGLEKNDEDKINESRLWVTQSLSEIKNTEALLSRRLTTNMILNRDC